MVNRRHQVNWTPEEFVRRPLFVVDRFDEIAVVAAVAELVVDGIVDLETVELDLGIVALGIVAVEIVEPAVVLVLEFPALEAGSVPIPVGPVQIVRRQKAVPDEIAADSQDWLPVVGYSTAKIAAESCRTCQSQLGSH